MISDKRRRARSAAGGGGPVRSSPLDRNPGGRKGRGPAANSQSTATTIISGRLDGIDGLRAAAALWVVGFHIHAFSHVRFPAWTGIDLFLRSGSTGVSLFLVLSGFCLYLPYAGGRSERFQAGAFFKRRFQRLMPAYCVALAGSAILAIVIPTFSGSPIDWRDIGLSLAAHLAQLQALFPSTFYSLNGAYWSLGLEWQLYLLLPLLILAVRRFGLGWTVVSVVLVNIAYRSALWAIDGRLLAHDSPWLQYVLPNQFAGRWAEFALGMVAAELYVAGRVPAVARKLWPALALLVPLSILLVGTQLSHIVFGSVFAILLLLVLSPGNPIQRVFSWRPLVAVGIMSYSLFLVHQPLVQFSAALLLAHGASHGQAFFELVLAIPLIFALAWALFIGVERRALTAYRFTSPGLLERVLFFRSSPSVPAPADH